MESNKFLNPISIRNEGKWSGGGGGVIKYELQQAELFSRAGEPPKIRLRMRPPLMTIRSFGPP
jgi:hypothetical protein